MPAPAPGSSLGLAFAAMDAAAAADWLAARPATAPFGYLVTPNADHLVRLQRDPELGAIYRNALLCLLDSRVVAGFGRLLGLTVPPVAPGSDVTEILLRRHLQAGERITIVGLNACDVTILASRLGLADPAHLNPPIGFEHDLPALAAVVDFVVAHPSRFVFFAVGSPRQERLAAAVASTGRTTGTGLCIGASLAYLAGVEKRAPIFMRQAGLEWLFRLLSNPRRMFARYVFSSPRVFGLLLRERMRRPASRSVMGARADDREAAPTPHAAGGSATTHAVPH